MSSSKPETDAARAAAALGRYLRRAVHSVQEAERFLRRRGVSGAGAKVVLGGVQARGWLDDRACARLWAEHWARQGYAWSAIEVKLSAKGLQDDAICACARRLGRSSDDEARARRLAADYLQRHPPARGGPRAAAGLARILASRGFDPELIERVLQDRLGCLSADAER